MRYIAKKAGQKMEQAFRGSYSQERPSNSKKSGDVTIDKMPNSKTKHKKKVGEYVDYEEID